MALAIVTTSDHRSPKSKINNNSGNLLVIIPIVMAILIGSVYIYNYLNSLHQNLGYANQKNEMHQAASKIFSGIKNSFNHVSTGCLDTSAFFKIKDSSTSDIVINDLTTLTSCLLSESDATKLSEVNIEISRVPGASDAYLGISRIKVLIHLISKTSAFSPVIEVKEIHFLRLKISSFSDFALVVTEFNENSPIITYETGAKVYISGLTFVNNPSGPIPIEKFGSDDLTNINSGIIFRDAVLTNSPSITMPSAYQGSIGDLMKTTFPRGLHVNELTNAVGLPFLINSSVWNQNIDYYYPFNDGGYPLPGNSNYAHTSGGLNPGDSTRGAATIFPNTVVSDLARTCDVHPSSSLGDTNPLALYKDGQTVKLTLTSSKMACALVVADKLVIEIPAGGKAILIGSFWVKSIEVIGAGELTILNPLRYKELPDSLLGELSLSVDSIAQQFLMMRASTGRNFFLPLFRNASGIAGFLPTPLTDLFETCGSYKCWRSPIHPLDLENLYSQSGYESKVHFFVEEIL